MLGVEGSSVATTTTFPVSVVATPIVTTAATAVVAGGVGLIPLVTATTGDMDPRSLLVPVVPTLNGSNPIINNHTGTTTTTTNNNTVSPNNNNNNTSSINSNNPAAMEEEFVKPILKDGEMILEVECGQNKAAMYLSKLCQGSKGPCINFQSSWLTPNEFQFVSGRETAKDWKRSIRHHGKSLKLLLAKGILAVHPTMCDCEGCRIGAVLTRKGEKRRIPNGERKRKSTGNAPENSGSGAFRAVSNGGVTPVKGQDGPSEPKRLALDHKPQEGGQSPLKESSLMNLPESKDVPILRLPEVIVPDVTKMAVDNRLQGPTLLMPLISPGRVSDITIKTGVVATAAIASPVREHKELTPAKPSSDKRRHSSGGKPQNTNNSNNVVAAPDAPSEPAVTPDVKVISSSVGAGGSKADKSVDRLALYQAAVSATRAPLPLCNEQSVEGDSPIKMCDNDGNQSDGSEAMSVDSQNMDVLSPSKESSEFVASSPSGDVKAKPAPAVEACKTEPRDLRTEVQSLKLVTNHSTVSPAKPCEPSSNNSSSSASSLSPTKPLLSPSVSATAATSAAASHNKPSPTASIPKRADKEDRHKRPSSALSPPYRKSSNTSEHKTIRHPSPVRQPNDTAMKHSPVKSVKDHHHHNHHHSHHHHSSEKTHKDRKHESSASSSSSSDKERHASKEKDSSATQRHNSERDLDKRRPEERSDKDRKSGVTSAQSIKSEEPSYRSTEYPSSGGSNRGEGGSVPMASAPLSVPPQMADPAAFSEYMRVLAAGHHGLVAPQSGMLQHMFPLRPPTDIPVTASALMHPMHAAACGMFSTPSALLQKDPVLYPTTAGTLPTASYPYGAPGMAPLHLMQPQYPSAASTAMLDYSRSFPYLHWSGGLPMMTSADAIAAAVAASSSAKRSREEMESAAADMNAKRLQLPMAAAYGAASMAPIDYMAAYRGLAANPLSCGMESSMYDKNAEYMRSRLFAGGAVASPSGPKGITSPYLASLPEYYRNLYCCRCMENRPGDIRTWGVEDVVKLVSSLEGCSVYTEIFREQRVDGKILVLLTADHLMKSLGMKLGPAVTLTNRVAKLLLESTQASGCDTCSRLAAMVPSVQSASGY